LVHAPEEVNLLYQRSGQMLKNIAKYATGIFYLLGGPLIHGFLITQQRDLYAAVDDSAWPLYQLLWSNFVLSNLSLLVFLLVILEMAAGVLMLSARPQWAKLGQLAGLLFNLLLVPFWFFYGIPNLLLVALHFWLWQEGQSNAHSKLLPVG
jgi:hypothetical protein